MPYDKDEVCDICGLKGAYDFMGDLICDGCLALEEEDNFDPEAYLADEE